MQNWWKKEYLLYWLIIISSLKIHIQSEKKLSVKNLQFIIEINSKFKFDKILRFWWRRRFLWHITLQGWIKTSWNSPGNDRILYNIERYWILSSRVSVLKPMNCICSRTYQIRYSTKLRFMPIFQQYFHFYQIFWSCHLSLLFYFYHSVKEYQIKNGNTQYVGHCNIIAFWIMLFVVMRKLVEIFFYIFNLFLNQFRIYEDVNCITFIFVSPWLIL